MRNYTNLWFFSRFLMGFLLALWEDNEKAWAWLEQGIKTLLDAAVLFVRLCSGLCFALELLCEAVVEFGEYIFEYIFPVWVYVSWFCAWLLPIAAYVLGFSLGLFVILGLWEGWLVVRAKWAKLKARWSDFSVFGRDMCWLIVYWLIWGVIHSFYLTIKIGLLGL